MYRKWSDHVIARKGYLKIHVSVDIKKKKILSLSVTDEKIYDGEVLQALVEDIVKTQKPILLHLLQPCVYCEE
jgi:hypothetical protein